MINQSAEILKQPAVVKVPPPEDEFTRFINEIRLSPDYSEKDIELVTSAYLFARAHFDEGIHKSGIPLNQHCMNLVKKLLAIKSDAKLLAAGFLHDILKHTDVQMDDLTGIFGDEIAQLVSGSQKFHVPESQKKRYLENIEKLFMEMAKDPRIVIIRLVHRMDDLEYIDWRKPDEKKKLIKETQELFIPLADKMGMRSIRGKLEDLTFKHTSPAIYTMLSKKLEQTKKEDELYLDYVEKEIKKLLIENSIQGTIIARIKNIYSLSRKMIIQKKPLDKLLDKLAIRIIVDDIPTCYKVLGLIHTNFTHVPDTFDDYISLPKANNYQSLHTCIYPLRNVAEKPVEIQIRTYTMHQVAEYGIAAHWKYKENSDLPGSSARQFQWIKSLLDLKKIHKSSSSFYSALKKNISLKYIIVFDEAGKVTYIPKGSTPLDCALHRGLSIDLKQDKVKINGKLAKFNVRLKDGDSIEILQGRE